MKIFVSYTHADKWQVKQIAEILESGGHDLWYDHKVTVGHDWKQAQQIAIYECDAFLWLLSPESVKSDWCQWEFVEAVKASKPIIPVLIQPNTVIPKFLVQRQYADFTEGATAINVARLMAGVQNALYIPVEDISHIKVFPRGVPHSVKHSGEDDSLIFVSYTRKDIEFAKLLREKIFTYGHKPWMDIYDIADGEYWPDAIDDALDNSSILVGIMSQHSVKSPNVKNEWDWALEYNVPLLLLRIQDCRIPHRYIRINYVDFVDNQDSGFARLKSTLASPLQPQYSLDSRRPKSPKSDSSSPSILDDNRVKSTPPALDRESAVSAEAAENVGVSTYIDEPEQTLSDTDIRNRNRMIEKVRKFWIHGVLESSLHGAALIDLNMQEQRGSVDHPWNSFLKHDDYGSGINVGSGIGSVFDRMSGELLILGDPGSGKTTMLLELARNLLHEAEEDAAHPVPVVFNLSSWAESMKPLEEWLIDELNVKYQVPKKVGETWINEDSLVLLLDGLDEVKVDSRNECVEAINTFRGTHGFARLAVCSRIRDYEELKSRLRLQGAIVIQPLEESQIYNYLESAGDELKAVRTLIEQDDILLDLVKTPLMLSIVTIAYRGLSTEQLDDNGNIQDRREHLLDTYIDRMFSRGGNSNSYSPENTIDWLAWLASNMVDKSQTIFLIEKMQPSWLISRVDQTIYALSFRFILVVAALSLSFFVGLAFGGLSAGAVGGLIGGVIGAAFGIIGQPSKTQGEKSGGIRKLFQVVLSGLALTIPNLKTTFSTALVGAIGGGFIGPVLGIVFLADGNAAPDELVTLLYSTFITGVILGGIVSGTIITLIIDEEEIITIESLSFSLKHGLTQLRRIWLILLLGQPALIFLAHFFNVNLGMTSAIAVFLGGNLIITTTVTIASSLINQELTEKSRPNQGIWTSLRLSVSGAIITGTTMGIIGGLATFSMSGTSMTAAVASFAIIAAIAGGVVYGGSTCIQHLTLRLILWSRGKAPLNYAKFLNYSCDRIFIRRVGGGYIFIHRIMLEHFASKQKPD